MKNSNIWKLIKKYKFKSIFFKYLKYMILLVIIPSVLFSSIIFVSNNTLKNNEIVALAKNKSDKYNQFFEKTFEANNKYFSQCLSNKYITAMLNSPPVDGKTLLTYTNEIFDLWSTYRTNYEMIYDIGIYNPKTNYIQSLTESNYLHNSNDALRNEVFFDTNNETGILIHPKNRNIIFKYSITQNKSVKGLFFIVLDRMKIIEELSNYKTFDNEYVIIKDEKYDKIIFSSTNAETPEIFTEKSIPYNEITPKKLLYYQNSLIISQKIENTDFTVYTILDKTSVSGYSKSNNQNLIIYYNILIIILLTILAFFISKLFYNSIVKVAANFELPVGEDINESNSSYNELLYINNNIINLIKDNKKIEIELANKLNKLKKSQTIALQTQINPHFVFNTLNLINSIIIEHNGEDCEEVELICTLASLLKNSLNTVQYIIPFSQELDYAEKYLKIELTKYCELFEVKYDIDPDIMECLTVKMILQPILENAISHGVIKLDDDKKGIITLKAYTENNSMYIVISDNGPGMSKEKLKEMKEKLLLDEIPESRHLGLCNVSNRIKLIYEDKSDLSIESSEKGTTVTIKQPLRNITL